MSGWNQRPIGQTFYQEEPSRRHQEMNSGNYTSTRIRSHERAVTRIWDKTSNFQESRNNKIENQIFITGILLWNLLFLPSCSLTFYFPKDMPRYVTNQEVYGRLVNLGIERDVVSCLMKLLRKIQETSFANLFPFLKLKLFLFPIENIIEMKRLMETEDAQRTWQKD